MPNIDETHAKTHVPFAKLIGHDVKLALRGEEFYGGITLRWGRLVRVDTDGTGRFIVDNYHDSAGFGDYPSYSKHDGVEVPFAEVVRIERDWHQV